MPTIKEAFERATASPLTHGWTPWEAKEAVRAYGLAVLDAALPSPLSGATLNVGAAALLKRKDALRAEIEGGNDAE